MFVRVRPIVLHKHWNLVRPVNHELYKYCNTARPGSHVVRTLVTASNEEQNTSKKKKLPELDMADFGESSDLTEADVHIGRGEARPPAAPQGKYVGIIDANNPPKLTHEHYKMLKGIDFTGRLQWRMDQSKEEEGEWKKKITAMQLRTDARFKFNLDELLSLDSQKSQKSKKEIQRENNPFNTTEKKEEIIDEYTFEQTTQDPMEVALRKLNQMKEDEGGDDFEPIYKKKNCIFCQPDPSRRGIKKIDYTNVQLLHQFINERGMIKNRRFTSNCMKHQKQIKVAIKRARAIGLLSAISNWSPPHPDRAELYGNDITDRFDEEFGGDAFGPAVDFNAPDFTHRVNKEMEALGPNLISPKDFEKEEKYRKKKERQRELRGASHKRKQKNPKDIPGARERAEYIRFMEESENMSNMEEEDLNKKSLRKDPGSGG